MRNTLYLPFFLLVLVVALVGCQRIHTETSGGTKPKTQVKYEDAYINTDPNLPGDRRNP
jgi:hypothetical protein